MTTLVALILWLTITAYVVLTLSVDRAGPERVQGASLEATLIAE